MSKLTSAAIAAIEKKAAAKNGKLDLAICEHLGYEAAARRAGGKVPVFLSNEVGNVKRQITAAKAAAKKPKAKATPKKTTSPDPAGTKTGENCDEKKDNQ